MRVGKKVNSDSLIDSGKDAISDVFVSTATVLAAVIYMLKGLSIEGYVGVLIGVIIIKAGFETLRETVSKILGERIDTDLAHSIKETINSVDKEIYGTYDLVLNNYGPDQHLGSAHIEVPENWTASKIDEVSRKIAEEVYIKNGVMMSAVGIYSVNTSHDEVGQMREKVSQIVLSHKEVLQMHGFYVDKERKIIRFDIIVSFDSLNMQQLFNHVVDDVKAEFPDYNVQVQFDTDISD